MSDFQPGRYRVVRGRIERFAALYRGPRFHAVLCDPPYGLSFMGKGWDHGVPGEAIWSGIYDHLLPGAPLLAFGGTRTFHRLMVAIEDAGFELRDTLMWITGQGFPKSHSIETATGDPAWRGYGSALKPAYEPCILAMKPNDGSFAKNALKYGVAGLNIDGGRIGTNGESIGTRSTGGFTAKNGIYHGDDAYEVRGRDYDATQGRWPANVILSHHPECVEIGVKQVRSDGHYPASRGKGGLSTSGHGGQDELDERYTEGETVPDFRCHLDCPIRLLDEQSGTLTSGVGAVKRAASSGYQPPSAFGRENRPAGTPNIEYGDTGGASRFFYTSKASGRERHAGLDDLPAQKRDDSRHANQPSMNGGEGNPYNRGVKRMTNHHPTVKPLAICKYLATLLLPPPGPKPRRILVPFCGSGSEMIGALLAGWDEVIGVEMVPEYVDIANGRLAWWTKMMRQLHTNDIDRIMEYAGPAQTRQAEPQPLADLPLFASIT